MATSGIVSEAALAVDSLGTFFAGFFAGFLTVLFLVFGGVFGRIAVGLSSDSLGIAKQA